MQYLTHFRSGSIKLVIFCRTTYSMSLESTKLKSRTSESSCSAKEIEINAPETAVHDQENGNGNGQQSGTVSKWVDPGKETKSTMEQDTRVNSVGRFYCCIVWRSQNFNSPTSNTVSHFKIVPLWLFYLLHVSFTRNSAVHRLRRKISTVFQLRLRRVDLKDWSHEKRHVSFPHKIDRYARVSNYDIRHWINDEFSPKMIVYPWQRAYLHTAVSRGCFLHLKLCVQGLFWPTTSTGMKWDNIYLLVLLFIDLLQRRPGNSAPVPFGNMENL